MTALRFRAGGRHQTSPASHRGRYLEKVVTTATATTKLLISPEKVVTTATAATTTTKTS